MKRLFIVSLAVIGLAACTSNPYKPASVEPRKPSGLGAVSANSVENVSGAALEAAGDTVVGSLTVSQISGNASGDIAASDNGILGPFSTSANASQDIALIGSHVGGKSVTLVVVAASETGKVSNAVAGEISQVVTNSGLIFSAAVDESKQAIGVSVDFSKEKLKKSGELIVNIGGQLLGVVKLSSDKAKEISEWTPDTEKKEGFSNWSVDKSGNLYYHSKGIVGVVKDTSGDVVKFILKNGGELLTISKNVVVGSVVGSGRLISEIAVASAKSQPSQYISGKVVSSAQGSVAYVTWSGRNAVSVTKFVFASIRTLLHSKPVERPVSPAPGSSAAAPGASQSN